MNDEMELERKSVCDVHGEFISKRRGLTGFARFWSGCPSCEETIRLNKTVEAKQRERLEWIRRINGAGIPERFRFCELATFQPRTSLQREALDFATEYANHFDEVRSTGRSAIFIGPPGTGKTHLAMAIARHVLRAGRRVRYSTVLRAMRRIKETWNKPAVESESEAINDFTSPDLLILDEVGVQFGSETEQTILFDILDERYAQCRPTLLLSNGRLVEVKVCVGERIFDRLRENGGRCLVFDGESMRGVQEDPGAP